MPAAVSRPPFTAFCGSIHIWLSTIAATCAYRLSAIYLLYLFLSYLPYVPLAVCSPSTFEFSLRQALHGCLLVFEKRCLSTAYDPLSKCEQSLLDEGPADRWRRRHPLRGRPQRNMAIRHLDGKGRSQWRDYEIPS